MNGIKEGKVPETISFKPASKPVSLTADDLVKAEESINDKGITISAFLRLCLKNVDMVLPLFDCNSYTPEKPGSSS